MRDFPRITAPEPQDGLRDARVLDAGSLPFSNRYTDGVTTRVAGPWVFIDGEKEAPAIGDSYLTLRGRHKDNEAVSPVVDLDERRITGSLTGWLSREVPLESLTGSGAAMTSHGEPMAENLGLFTLEGGAGLPSYMPVPLVSDGLAGGVTVLPDFNNGSATRLAMMPLSNPGRGEWSIGPYRPSTDPAETILALPRTHPMSNRRGAVLAVTPGFNGRWGAGYARPDPVGYPSVYGTYVTTPAYVTFNRSGQMVGEVALPHNPAWGAVFPPIIGRASRKNLAAVVFYTAPDSSGMGGSFHTPQVFWSSDNGATWIKVADFPDVYQAKFASGGRPWMAILSVRMVPLTSSEVLVTAWLPSPLTSVASGVFNVSNSGSGEVLTATPAVPVSTGPGRFVVFRVSAAGVSDPLDLPINPTEFLMIDPADSADNAMGAAQNGDAPRALPPRNQFTGICRPAGGVVMTFAPRWPYRRHLAPFIQTQSGYEYGSSGTAPIRYYVPQASIDPEPMPATPATASRLVICTKMETGLSLVARNLPWHWRYTASAAFCFEDGIGVVVGDAAGVYAVHKSTDLGLTWKKQMVVDRLAKGFEYRELFPADVPLNVTTGGVWGLPGDWPLAKYSPHDTSLGYPMTYVAVPPWSVACLELDGEEQKPYVGATWI